MSQSNKDFAKQAQAILEAQGHSVPLGHIYEMFAKLGGYNDWNTAKAKGLRFEIGTPLTLRPGEEKIIQDIISQMDDHDTRTRDCKVLTISTEAKVWCKLQGEYKFKPGVEVTKDLIQQYKQKFLEELEKYEGRSPAANEHIECHLVTAQGYLDEVDQSDMEADVENNSDRLDWELGVGRVSLPSIEEYAKIAEGLRMRKAKLDAGLISFSADTEEME